MKVKPNLRNQPRPTLYFFRVVGLIGLIAFSLSSSASAADQKDRPVIPASNTLTLESAIAQALQNNPGLHAMQAMKKAKASIPSQRGALPDPELSLTAANLPTDTFDRQQEPMTQYKVGVSQRIPFPGKLGLKEDSANFNAQSAVQEVEEFVHGLKTMVTGSWWELFYLDRSLEVIKRNQALLRQFVEIAKTKYQVGQGLQQDALLAQVELSKLLDLEIQLHRLRDKETAMLNGFLNRAPLTAIHLSAQTDTQLPLLLPETTLYGLAEENRPLLESLRNRVKAANSRLELAHKDYYPNFMFGVEYGKRYGENANGTDRSDLASVKVGISVPIFAASKQSEAVKQRQFELEMNQSTFENQRVQMRTQISTLVSEYRNTVDQAQLFSQGIVPQAQQAVDSMKAAYRVNKVDFLNLVRMQMTLQNYETQYWRVFTRAEQTLSKLETLVGIQGIYVTNTKQP